MMEIKELTNNQKRKEWLESYHDWPVWFTVSEADETYYKYDFADGSSIVICEYAQYIDWKEKYINEDPETLCTRLYLLKPGYHHLADCQSNTSALIEYLRDIRRRNISGQNKN